MPKAVPSAKNRLKNLRAYEVSCVKSGANRRKWAIIKSEEGSVNTETPTIPAMLTAEELADVRAYVQMRNEAIEKADGDERNLSDVHEATLQAIKRLAAPLKDSLTIADLVAMGAQAGLSGAEEVDEDDMDDDNLEAAEFGEPVEQAEEAPVKVDKDMDWQMPKPEGVSDDEHQAGMKAAKAAYMGKMGKTEKADDEEDEGKSAGVDKSSDDKECEVKKTAEMDADSKAYFEDVQKRHERLLTKCAELEGKISAMEDEKELSGYEARLSAELPNLSIDRAATAKVLKSISGDKVAHDNYWATLKAAHEQVKVAKSYRSGLYGSSRGNQGEFASYHQGNATAQQRMDSMMQEQIQKSGSTDRSAAWQSLIKNPEFAELYEQTSNGGV